MIVLCFNGFWVFFCVFGFGLNVLWLVIINMVFFGLLFIVLLLVVGLFVGCYVGLGL